MILSQIEEQRAKLKMEDDLRRAEWRYADAVRFLARVKEELESAIKEETLARKHLERVKAKKAAIEAVGNYPK